MSNEPPYSPEPYQNANETLSLWNRQYGADFKKLFVGLVKLGAGAAVQRWDQVAAGAADAAVTFRADLPPEGLYWQLVRRSLEAAVFGLVAQSAESDALTSFAEAGAIGDELDAALEQQPAEVWPEFLRRPADLPFFSTFQAAFHQWLVRCGMDAREAKNLQRRLPVAFLYAARREWDRHSDGYGRLDKFLKGDLAQADARERAWQVYAARLERDAQEPVLLEPVSLDQIYVRPRAFYLEERQEKDRDFRYQQSEQVRMVVELHAYLEGWAAEPRRERAILVLSGDPGSGKSSCSRMFSVEQARQGRKVLRIPLHEYRSEAGLAEGVAEFAPWSLPELGSPLDEQTGVPDLLLILDGLDELAQADSAGAELALGLVEKVGRWVEEAWRRNWPVQVLLTGRTPVVQSLSGKLPDRAPVLELLPFGPPWSEGPEFVDRKELLAADQRHTWWEQYAPLAGLSGTQMPARLLEGDLGTFTQQPLLCALAVRWWRGRTDAQELEIVNRNQVILSFLEDLYEGTHNSRRLHPTLRDLRPAEFVRILEEVALVVWRHGGRTAPVEAVCAHLRDNRAVSRLLGGDVEDALRGGLLRLLTAFYFRRSETSRWETGSIEFTHKQFSEYLLACRMARAVRELHEGLNGDAGSLNEEEALARWAGLFAPFAMNLEVLQFLQDELRMQSGTGTVGPREWTGTLVLLLNRTISPGIPMKAFSATTDLQFRQQSPQATASLLAAADACRRATTPADGSLLKPLGINWAAADNVRRVHRRHWLVSLLESPAGDVARQCIGGLSLQAVQLDYLLLPWADLAGANLERANLTGANLTGANLTGANLTEAYLTEANLTKANLAGVNLEGAFLEGANLSKANLRKANLERANLERANLERANLAGVNLEGAFLEGAFLTGAFLTGANLAGANPTGAYLISANLINANLIKANLEGANLEGAFLEGANLAGANLARANLAGINLAGANLAGARIGKSQLRNARGQWGGKPVWLPH